jgi:hypothetical protein
VKKYCIPNKKDGLEVYDLKNRLKTILADEKLHVFHNDF